MQRDKRERKKQLMVQVKVEKTAEDGGIPICIIHTSYEVSLVEKTSKAGISLRVES